MAMIYAGSLDEVRKENIFNGIEKIIEKAKSDLEVDNGSMSSLKSWFIRAKDICVNNSGEFLDSSVRDYLAQHLQDVIYTLPNKYSKVEVSSEGIIDELRRYVLMSKDNKEHYDPNHLVNLGYLAL